MPSLRDCCISRRFVGAVSLLIPLAALPGCGEQPGPSAMAKPAVSSEDSLYRRLGGRPGVARLVDDWSKRLAEDRRFRTDGGSFDAPRFKAVMFQRICALAGGACRLPKGPPPPLGGHKARRAELAVRDDLLRSLQENNVHLQDQIWLLSLLYPVIDDIAKAKTQY